MSGSLIPNGKQQYFDANGTPLAGGKVYYYIPYTTTAKNTWQDINLSILNTNPIILDAAGECIAWGAGAYRQQVYDVNNNLIWDQYTYGINPAGSNFVSQEEVQTATQGQTQFSLTTITYTPGINSLVVFVNGSKQLVNVNYTETSSVVVTFASGLNAGDVVDFYASLPATAQNMSNAVTVAYDPPFTNSVATNVQAKFAQILSVKDFGAKGDGTTDDTQAIISALNAVQSYQILDLCNGNYAVYTGVVGTTGTTDAVTLSNTIRLYNKTNVTIRNGTIFAANPSSSSTVLNFPSTFSIDGCTNVRLENVNFYAKGQSYGNSDGSVSLTYAQRRNYIQQNGGSALIVVNSSGTTINQSNFYLAGSVGSVYISSSNETVLNDCFSSPQNLGYAAYAMDSWCGGISVTGFPYYLTSINDCRTDALGATYGSKIGVNVADADNICHVVGGIYKDCYANGGSGGQVLGNAFNSTDATLYVTGSQVDNCASVGMLSHAINDLATLIINGVIATNIRTSALIIDLKSFGTYYASLQNCNINIIGTSLWSAIPELSVSTVIANRTVTTNINVDILNCNIKGADTFEINSRACYGGIKITGGYYEVSHRIFDSLGWGGASSGSMQGYEIIGGAQFKITGSSTTNAVTNNSVTAINSIANEDGSSVFTYQYLDFDSSVIIKSVLFNNFISLLTYGTNLNELQILGQQLQNCYQNHTANIPYIATVKVISLDGISGSNSKITFAFLSNKLPGLSYIIDDTNVNRQFLGTYSGPTISSSLLEYGIFVNNSVANFTVGNTYVMNLGS